MRKNNWQPEKPILISYSQKTRLRNNPKELAAILRNAVMQYTARMHRRTLLETSIATSCLSALHVSLFVPEQRIDQVGLQLYTVRDLNEVGLRRHPR